MYIEKKSNGTLNYLVLVFTVASIACLVELHKTNSYIKKGLDESISVFKNIKSENKTDPIVNINHQFVKGLYQYLGIKGEIKDGKLNLSKINKNESNTENLIKAKDEKIKNLTKALNKQVIKNKNLEWKLQENDKDNISPDNNVSIENNSVASKDNETE